MTTTKRPDIPAIEAIEKADWTMGRQVILAEFVRPLLNWNRHLEKELSICNGTFEGELDGKPVSGTIMDGTDAACPGWWRGHHHGYARGKEYADPGGVDAEKERGEE